MTQELLRTHSLSAVRCATPSLVVLMLLLAGACGSDNAKKRMPPRGTDGRGPGDANADGLGGDEANAGERGLDGGGLDDAGGASVGLPADTPFFRSGSRLRANVVQGGDAQAAFEGWHDTELDVPCALRTASDGRIRCLPTTGESYAPWSGVFADAACTEPALLQHGGCAAPGPYHLVTEGGCGGHSTVHSVEAVAATRIYYTLQVDGSCIERSLGEDEALHRLGAAIEPSGFVAMQVSATVGARLTRQAYLGEDGSLESRIPVDTELGGEGCELRRIGDSTRCVPSARVYGTTVWYGGDDCASEPLAYGDLQKPGCFEPRIGLMPDFEGVYCDGPQYSLFLPGAPVMGTFYAKSGAMCTAKQTDDDDVLWTLYEKGESVPPDYLETVKTEALGEGRLRLRVERASDGQAVAYARHNTLPTFHDTLLDAPCVPTETHAHGLLCAPPAQGSFYYFADEACTMPVLALRAEVCGDTPKVVSLHGPRDTVCGEPLPPEKLAVFHVGSELPENAPLFVGDDGSSCSPLDVPPRDVRLFLAGESVALEDLAPLTRTRE